MELNYLYSRLLDYWILYEFYDEIIVQIDTLQQKIIKNKITKTKIFIFETHDFIFSFSKRFSSGSDFCLLIELMFLGILDSTSSLFLLITGLTCIFLFFLIERSFNFSRINGKLFLCDNFSFAMNLQFNTKMKKKNIF